MDTHNTYMSSLGISGLLNTARWAEPTEEISLEILTLWQPGPHEIYQLDVSTVHNVARLAIAFEGVTVIRLITPQHVWATTITHNTNTITHVEAEPTPLTRLYELADAMYLSSTTKEHAEMRLQIQHLLSTAAGDQQAAGAFHNSTMSTVTHPPTTHPPYTTMAEPREPTTAIHRAQDAKTKPARQPTQTSA